MRKILELLLAAAIPAAICITGCSPESHRREVKKDYGQIYQSSDGHYYTRSYDSTTGDFWFWMYIANSSSSSSSYGSPAYFNSGSWSRVSSPPATADLKPTNQVVEEKNGQPTNEVEPENAVPEGEVVSEETTVSEAVAGEQPVEEVTTESAGSGEAVSSPASESTSSGGESSGSTGGDSGGGGDGGGSD